MRTREDIYKDYLNWLYLKTGNIEYKYEHFFDESSDDKSVKARLWKEILELCYHPENGMYFFIKFIIGDLKEIGYPKPLRYNTLMRKWDNLVKSHKRLAIQCARGHGKSLFFSQLLNIYDMYLFSHRKIIIVSASQEQANRILTEMKTIIDGNEVLREKANISRWAAESIGFNKGYVLAKGITSEFRGEHVDRIIMDDVLRTDNKLSDSYIQEFMDMTLGPMLLNRNGQMIVVGTPMSETDLFYTIRTRIEEAGEDTVWHMYKFPAILDYDNREVLCPDRFTFEMLMRERMALGATQFGREFQLEVFSKDASLFPDTIVKPTLDKGKSYSYMAKRDARDTNWIYVIGVDVARSGSVSADYTVATVIAFNSVNQTKQLVYLWRKKGLKITEQAMELARLSKDFGNAMVFVETNNMGQDMIDTLVDTYNVHVEPYTTGRNKQELIRFLISSFEYEQFIIPQQDEESKKMFQPLLNELERFAETRTPAGNPKYEGVGGSKDDCVMSLALANRATQEISVPFAITDFGNPGDSVDPMSAFPESSYSRSETDLIRRIKMGLLK